MCNGEQSPADPSTPAPLLQAFCSDIPFEDLQDRFNLQVDQAGIARGLVVWFNRYSVDKRIDSEITASNQEGALVEISDAMKMRVQMKFCPTNSPQPGPGSLLEIESAIELTDAFLSWSKAQARAEAEKSPELAQPA